MNISNFLSFFRLFLSLPLAFALWNNEIILSFAIAFIAYISDMLDGYFARKYNQITEFGKIIDPIADKIFIGTAAIIMIIQGKLPLWFGLAVIGRDILILIFSLYAKRKIKFVLASDLIGKLAVSVLGLTIIIAFFEIHFLDIVIYPAALIAIVVSMVNYYIRMRRRIKGLGG